VSTKTRDVAEIQVEGSNKTNQSLKTSTGWYTLSKYNTELSLDLFQVGKTYQVEVTTGPKGGKYITGLVQKEEAVAPVKAIEAEYEKQFVCGTLKPLNLDEKPSAEYWEAKDRRISRAGLIQAAGKSVVSFHHVFDADKIAADSLKLALALNKQLQNWDE